MDRDNLYFLETIIFKVWRFFQQYVKAKADKKQVENRLFKVYQHHFMESEIFNTTCSLPSGNVQAEGTSEANPFVLHGIMANDFQALLKVITPL
jgi:hypothetical protein